ncbi:MAG: OsmC family protein [Gammaproteobacteria bacterium]|nr:OsmC family protein [Gammaproteobacteria bacterium]MCZ6772627.1 OsmC family protein [Pseudomonadota bacterium]
MNDSLRETISATQKKYRLNPAEALATFHSKSELVEGFRSDVTIRDHHVVVDEPPQLGGGDAGPNPIELLLAALGACQEITYKAYATAMGIDIERVSVELKGDIDLRGFFGVDETVRAGYQKIRGTVHIESCASREALEKLKAAVDAHCPLLDMLTTPVPISLELADADV